MACRPRHLCSQVVGSVSCHPFWRGPRLLVAVGLWQWPGSGWCPHLVGFMFTVIRVVSPPGRWGVAAHWCVLTEVLPPLADGRWAAAPPGCWPFVEFLPYLRGGARQEDIDNDPTSQGLPRPHGRQGILGCLLPPRWTAGSGDVNRALIPDPIPGAGIASAGFPLCERTPSLRSKTACLSESQSSFRCVFW